VTDAADTKLTFDTFCAGTTPIGGREIAREWNGAEIEWKKYTHLRGKLPQNAAGKFLQAETF
jgi:hypothetical protein